MKAAPPFSVGVAAIIEHSGELAHSREMLKRETAKHRSMAVGAASPVASPAAVGLPGAGGKFVVDNTQPLTQLGEAPLVAINLPIGTAIGRDVPPPKPETALFGTPILSASSAAVSGPTQVLDQLFDGQSPPASSRGWGGRQAKEVMLPPASKHWRECVHATRNPHKGLRMHRHTHWPALTCVQPDTL